MTKLKIAVIGCNNMGGKHIRVLRENFAAETEVVGILNRSTTKEKAAELGVGVFNNLDEITRENCDAVFICTPATAHADIAVEMLKRGLPTMLEKPMAASEAECAEIIKTAQKTGTPILVGHTENYNPAVIALKKDIKHPVKKIKGIRVSRNAKGKRVVTVVPELMIHDLAIVSSLLPQPPEKIAVSKLPQYDWTQHAKVKIFYPEAEVELEAAIADIPMQRYMEITDSMDNLYRIDFYERRLSKNGEVLLEGGDSLANEQRNFINMAQGSEAPYVSLAEALQNVKLCAQIEQHMI